MHQPRIFLSYTLNKAGHEPTMRMIVGAIKEVLGAEGIEAVDPMTTLPNEYSGISEDVVEDIQRSDAMFVIEYPPVPNTSYESGVAYALGIPAYHWLPGQRPGNEKQGFQAYLQYLGYQDGRIVLPSDQGDRRYMEFPGDLATSEESLKRFKQDLAACVQAMLAGPLSEHAVRARRKFRGLAALSVRMLKDSARHPAMCWVIGSLMRQHDAYLKAGQGSHRFEIDDSVYLHFLATLAEDPESAKRVLAVADIGSNLEKFWEKDGSVGISHVVGERIFRLPWRRFFESGELAEFLDVAKKLAAGYPVYVTDSDTREASLDRFMSRIGGDFVIFDDVAGYYEYDRLEQAKLIVRRDAERSALLRKEFLHAKTVSVRVMPDSRIDDIKREWMQRRRIGEWSEEYSGGDRRDERYYDNYDLHIRAWIPEYDEFETRVAGSIIRQLSAWIGKERRPLVGEIGVGTGAVTQIVARWADALVRAGIRPISRYVCVDSVAPMCKSVDKALEPFNSEKIFRIVRGLDFQALAAATDGRKYDIVCGSLILHYLLENPAEDAKWARFFDKLDSVLADNGVAIFGGCYFSEEPGARERQLSWWMRQMCAGGLGKEAAERFMKGNPEMRAIPETAGIQRRSKGLFVADYERVGRDDSPFGILKLRRAPKAGAPAAAE
jgi:hypothetical protein